MYALSGGVARRDLAHHEDTKATKKERQENREQENEARRSLLSARIEPVSGHRDEMECKIRSCPASMNAAPMTEITQILSQIEQGDPSAAEQLLPLVYDELRKLATARMAHESPDHTLQATALVHEAYVRLVDDEQARHWNSRGHFFGAAAEAMRRILVERARRKVRPMHGGDRQRLPLSEEELSAYDRVEEVLIVHEALDKLALESREKAELVKLRYFAGFSVQEAADALRISRATADRHWSYARAFLFSELQDWKDQEKTSGT
jgi:RNA polymerase sigma factor (TIGR02999 family)